MEIWKTIKIDNEETRYEVSNKGRVRHIDKLHWKTGGILKPKHNKYNGYESYGLVHRKANKYKYAHRLVATYFIENPNNLKEVNHKDGNKRNNEVSNLEWIDRVSNTRHAFKNQLGGNVQQVKVYSLKGDYIGEFHSISEALRVLGVKEDSYNNRINVRSEQSHGYQWRRVGIDDDIPVKNIYDKWVSLGGCVQLTLDGEFIRQYETIADACKELGVINNGLISQACKNNRKKAYGYKWAYAKEYFKEQ